MLESIDLHSDVPPYAQIENHVQFGIASGHLKAGDRLPPMRELAKRLGINWNTVGKSYRDLEVMGLVYTQRGVGFYINKGIEAKCREQCRQRIVARMHEVVAEAKAAGMTSNEIKRVVDKSHSSNVGPYGPTPDFVSALAKPKTSRK